MILRHFTSPIIIATNKDFTLVFFSTCDTEMPQQALTTNATHAASVKSANERSTQCTSGQKFPKHSQQQLVNLNCKTPETTAAKSDGIFNSTQPRKLHRG